MTTRACVGRPWWQSSAGAVVDAETLFPSLVGREMGVSEEEQALLVNAVRCGCGNRRGRGRGHHLISQNMFGGAKTIAALPAPAIILFRELSTGRSPMERLH